MSAAGSYVTKALERARLERPSVATPGYTAKGTTNMTTTSKRLTVADATRLLRERGMSIRWMVFGQAYRVSFAGRGQEASALYDPDLESAVGTALAMADHRDAAASLARIVHEESKLDLSDQRGV